MPAKAYEIHGVRIFECSTEGPPPRDEQDAVELMSEATEQGARFLVLPAEWLGDDFFWLSTRIAGAVIRKFVTCGFRAAIMGDISGYLAASSALRDFVYESNRGDDLWFLANLEEVAARLEQKG
jgi:Domain of unknown function (DUF4180)